MNDKKFVYAFNEEDKKELILNGFKYICEQHTSDGTIYIFNNDSKKLNFTLDKSKYVMDNKLFF